MIFDALELNYSKINAYINCPLLYKFIYVEKKYTPVTAASSLGLSVHKAIARYHAQGRNLNDLMCFYQDLWLNQGYASPQQTMEFYRKGEKILENWYLYHIEEKPKVIFWEKNFKFDFERWTIKGTIDRVDLLPSGAVEVIDYKMGFEEKSLVDTANSLQLGIYALAMKEAFNMEVDKLSYFILSDIHKVSVNYELSSAEKILNTIRDVGTKILNSDFTKRDNCAHCPIRKICFVSTAKD